MWCKDGRRTIASVRWLIDDVNDMYNFYTNNNTYMQWKREHEHELNLRHMLPFHEDIEYYDTMN